MAKSRAALLDTFESEHDNANETAASLLARLGPRPSTSSASSSLSAMPSGYLHLGPRPSTGSLVAPRPSTSTVGSLRVGRSGFGASTSGTSASGGSASGASGASVSGGGGGGSRGGLGGGLGGGLAHSASLGSMRPSTSGGFGSTGGLFDLGRGSSRGGLGSAATTGALGSTYGPGSGALGLLYAGAGAGALDMYGATRRTFIDDLPTPGKVAFDADTDNARSWTAAPGGAFNRGRCPAGRSALDVRACGASRYYSGVQQHRSVRAAVSRSLRGTRLLFDRADRFAMAGSIGGVPAMGARELGAGLGPGAYDHAAAARAAARRRDAAGDRPSSSFASRSRREAFFSSPEPAVVLPSGRGGLYAHTLRKRRLPRARESNAARAATTDAAARAARRRLRRRRKQLRRDRNPRLVRAPGSSFGQSERRTMIGGPSDHTAARASVERRRGRRGPGPGRNSGGRGGLDHDMDAYMGVLDEGQRPPPLPAAAGAAAAATASDSDGPQVERWNNVVEQKEAKLAKQKPFGSTAERAAASAEKARKAGRRLAKLRSPPGSPFHLPKAGVTSLSPPPALSIFKKEPGQRNPRPVAERGRRSGAKRHLTGFRALPASPPPLAPALGRVTPLSPWGKPAHGASSSSVPTGGPLVEVEYKEGSLEAVVSNRATMVTGAGEDFDRGVARYEGLLN